MTCQSVWDDFVKLVHLVGHPGESYIIYIIGMRLVGLINPHNLIEADVWKSADDS